MLTGKQRAFLRSKAALIDCTVQIGKGGVTENLLVTIEQALAAHEMVKIKCLENAPYTPREASDGICEAIGADGVQCIGNKFVLFKISPEHRKYDLDKLCEIEEKKDQSAAKSAPNARRGAGAAPKPRTPRTGGRPAPTAVRGSERSASDGKKPGYTVRKRTK